MYVTAPSAVVASAVRSQLEQSHKPEVSTRFQPSRLAALARLEEFLPNAGDRYTQDRNNDPAPAERHNVSMLSPYLRHRAISEVDVLKAVLSRSNPAACGKFIQEVFWRGYFKGWLEHRPFVWQQYESDVREQLDAVGKSGELATGYQAAIDGRTGIEVFDTWATELTSTGYLHNHARMWLASIWIFTLRLPWQLGADWFLQHLLDGDPASNTCSWRWVAGLHTRGKTYLARPDNIQRYAPRFFECGDSAGLAALATEARPLTESPDLLELPRVTPDWPMAGPAPAEQEARSNTALLLHDDDLGVGDTSGYAAVAALTPTALSPVGHPDRVLDFRRGLTSDAVRGDAAVNHSPPNFADAAEIADWLRSANLSSVMIPYAPVGPTAARLAAVVIVLKQAGIDVQMQLTPFDALVWPHAKAGFFKLGQKIPLLLDALSSELHTE